MLQLQFSGFYQRSIFLTFFLVCSITLQCCGSRLTQSKSSKLEIFLEIPQGEDPSLFWYGVQKKILRWKPGKGEVQEAIWEIAAKAPWEVNDGDLLEFIGADESARVVVSGEVKVTEEKKVTIPLRRVL